MTAAYMDSLRKDPFLPYYADPASADEQKAKRDRFTARTQSTCKLSLVYMHMHNLMFAMEGVAWSHPGPAHAVRDDSVLAVGHKSGHVTFWR